MLKFQPFSIDKKSLLDKFFSAYGDGSCQHSFVSSFCMFEKYGDHFAIKDDFLFVRREKRCTNQSLVYLFPFGDMGDPEKVRHAVDSVIEDARSHGCKVRFETVTEKAKNFIMENYPGIFSVTELRDAAEYILHPWMAVSIMTVEGMSENSLKLTKVIGIWSQSTQITLMKL